MNCRGCPSSRRTAVAVSRGFSTTTNWRSLCSSVISAGFARAWDSVHSSRQDGRQRKTGPNTGEDKPFLLPTRALDSSV